MTNYDQSSDIQTTTSTTNEGFDFASLDNLKAFFYLYNAKPDTEIRFLKGGKIIDLGDIRSIEEQVGAKLANHDTIVEKTSISFTLSNNRLKEFSTWAEFEREKWNTINEKIESIHINWNILIKLPQFKSPQTHSMKLRVGNSIPPRDMFQLFLTSDDISEVMEAGSPGVCKVDFINTIVANELLFIVDEWYKGLKTIPDLRVFQQFLKKRGKTATQFIRMCFPVLLLLIFCQFSDYLYSIMGISKEITINSLQTSTVFLFSIFLFGSFVGNLIEKSIDNEIDKFEQYPTFLITKGDSNSAKEFEDNNGKLVNKIVLKVLLTLITAPISFFIKFLLGQVAN